MVQLSAQRISNFLGEGVWGNSIGMVEFKDVTDLCKDIQDFEENAEAGQCFKLGRKGYVYKIKDKNGDHYSVVIAGDSLACY